MSKKLLTVVSVLLCACMILGGCGAKSVDEYLKEAKYEEAYEVAETSEEKRTVKAENTFAYLCERCIDDAFDGEDVDLKLKSAWYVSGELLTDYFEGYKYYLMKVEFEDAKTGYLLYNFNIEEKIWNNMFNTLVLYEDDSDSTDDAFLKELCRTIIGSDNSYKLGSESLDRINALIENDLLEEIDFFDELFL